MVFKYDMHIKQDYEISNMILYMSIRQTNYFIYDSFVFDLINQYRNIFKTLLNNLMYVPKRCRKIIIHRLHKHFSLKLLFASKLVFIIHFAYNVSLKIHKKHFLNSI